MKTMKKLAFLKILILVLLSSPAIALTFELLPNNDNVVGQVQHVLVEPGDNFSTIARRYDVGYYELVEANPKLDPETPKAWADIIIPTQFILPPVPRQGVVISLVELRLYYFPLNENKVLTFPVGIGREGWKTPVGISKIIEKEKDPVWTVPVSIQQDALEQGNEPFPAKVPPGPDNPLGKFALRLSLQGYLIHGTNRPEAIGMRATAGCIRMFPEDIENLFNRVQKGTPVRIIDEAFKAGWLNQHLYLEAHLPLQEQQEKYTNAAHSMIKIVNDAAQHYHAAIDWDKANEVASQQNGIPTRIGSVLLAQK